MSILADIRQDCVDLVSAALPSGVPVYEFTPDDIQDPPCVIFDIATVQRSFVTSGQSVTRQSLYIVPFRGAPKDTVANLDELTSIVWEALGAGGIKLLPISGCASQPQSAQLNNLSIGETTWPAIRVDTDVQIATGFC